MTDKALTTIEQGQGVAEHVAPGSAAMDRGNPAAAYVASLTTEAGRRNMKSALKQIAGLQGAAPDSFPWHALKAEHVAAIRAQLLVKGYKPATVNTMLAALRGVAKSAWRMGYLSAEELAKVQDIGNVRSHTELTGRAVNSGEIGALAAACARDTTPAGARDAAIIGIAYATGARRSELVGLDLADLTFTDGQIDLLVRGKGNKERILPVDNGAKEALENWLTYRGSDPGPLFVAIDKVGRLARGRRLTSQAVYYMLQRRQKEAGVKAFTPHDLRRSCCSDLLDAGADVLVVSGLMGHSNVATTRRYDRRGERARRQAVKSLHFPYRRPERLA